MKEKKGARMTEVSGEARNLNWMNETATCNPECSLLLVLKSMF